MKRVIGATLAVAACSVGLAVGAQASNGDKVWLCHGTSSENNPYVLINVSQNALGGHLDGTGPGHGHGTNPNHNEDYVLRRPERLLGRSGRRGRRRVRGGVARRSTAAE